VQNPSEEAKRSLKAFCKKATSEAYTYPRILPSEKGIKKIWG